MDDTSGAESGTITLASMDPSWTGLTVAALRDGGSVTLMLGQGETRLCDREPARLIGYHVHFVIEQNDGAPSLGPLTIGASGAIYVGEEESRTRRAGQHIAAWLARVNRFPDHGRAFFVTATAGRDGGHPGDITFTSDLIRILFRHDGAMLINDREATAREMVDAVERWVLGDEAGDAP